MGPMGDPTVNLLSVLPPSNPSMHKKAGNLEGMDSSSVACDWLTDCTRTVPPADCDATPHAHSTRLPNCVYAVTYSSIT